MKTSSQRFWDKVDIHSGPIHPYNPALGKCWLWTASTNGKGYGFFFLDGKNHMAHKIAMILDGSIIKPGNECCHSCDNPSCVRPSHLFQGTKSDNQRDASTKGRSAKENLKKTHCPAGHPYSGDNLLLRTKPNGKQERKCRARHAEKVLAKYHENKRTPPNNPLKLRNDL